MNPQRAAFIAWLDILAALYYAADSAMTTAEYLGARYEVEMWEAAESQRADYAYQREHPQPGQPPPPVHRLDAWHEQHAQPVQLSLFAA